MYVDVQGVGLLSGIQNIQLRFDIYDRTTGNKHGAMQIIL